MAEYQVTPLFQVGTDGTQDALLGHSIEIDDDIPAENNIELPLERKPFIHEIDADEFYPVAQFLFYADLRLVRIPVAEQILLLVRKGNGNHAVGVVYTGHGGLECMGRDIGSHDPVVKTGMLDAEFGENHGQGIRLFAGCASG